MSNLERLDFAQSGAPTRLSVLIPTFRDDASALLRALIRQSAPDIEILIYDDGSERPEQKSALIDAAKSASQPVTLLFAAQNRGRSAARNALVEHARGNWLLFLDADMMPVDDQFLARYITRMRSSDSDVIFGGFQMPKKTAPKFELHRAFSQSSDCLSAAQRLDKGPQYVCSSNLAVRKSVLLAEPFDTEFTGWGWEDSEWAARISKSYRLTHIDNPAVHLGLETADSLLSRFASSAANYDRFVCKHPELARSLALYRIMRKMARLPGQQLAQPLYRMIAKSGFLPSRWRLLALKFWRASHYAQKCRSAIARTAPRREHFAMEHI